MQLRPYQVSDKAACLAIFDGNTPPYFGVDERPGFDRFLDAPDCPYYVVEDGAQLVIGCGGFFIKQDAKWAGLAWGMVARDVHRHGVGRYLLLARLDAICKTGLADQVMIDTSQHTAGFFEKVGFQVNRIVENAFAPGLHRYEMALTLNTDRCAEFSRSLDSF